MDDINSFPGFEGFEWNEPPPVPDHVRSGVIPGSPNSPGGPSAAVLFLPRAVPPGFPLTPEELEELQATNSKHTNDLSTGEGEPDTILMPLTLRSTSKRCRTDNHFTGHDSIEDTGPPFEPCGPSPEHEARCEARYNLYKDTLNSIGSRYTWLKLHATALTLSENSIKSILTRLCYLAALKNSAAPEIHARQHLIRSRQVTNIEPHIIINHIEWIRFIGRFPALVSQVMKHVTWVELLNKEYRKAEPAWKGFWDDVERHGGLPGMHHMDALDAMHKKRVFLQGKIVDGEAVLANLFMQEPIWLQWEVNGL